MSWIALATYRRSDRLAPALVLNNKLYDLEAAISAGVPNVQPDWLGNGVEAMVKNWSKAQPWLKEATPAAAKLVASGALEPIEGDAASVAAPFVPQLIFYVASNYANNASEMGTTLAAKAQRKTYRPEQRRVGKGDGK